MHCFRAVLTCCLLGAACLLWSGCDTVEPGEGPLLVVEGFLDAGKPLPELVLRQTRPLDTPYPDDATTAVTDASVALTLDGQRIAYRPVDGRPGRYAPEGTGSVPSRASFSLDVAWGDQRAAATGTVPPPIAIDSIRVDVPEAPVEAVRLDSLLFADSLGVHVEEGYIYPVEVTVWWRTGFAETDDDSLYWVETQLRPRAAFASTGDDFFLRPEQILRERTVPRDAYERRRWTGVYAVPVATATAPMPAHRLRVSLLRGGRDYAQFASSRDAPERREPVSNVEGALGIVAGVSIDSLTVWVGQR